MARSTVAIANSGMTSGDCPGLPAAIAEQGLPRELLSIKAINQITTLSRGCNDHCQAASV